MEVEDCLVGALAVVDDHSIAILLEAKGSGDLGRREQEVSQQGALLFARFCEHGDGALGDDEDVLRCHWIDVLEREAVDVLMHDLRRNLAPQYLPENRVAVVFAGRFCHASPFHCNPALLAVPQDSSPGSEKAQIPKQNTAASG